MKDSHSHLRSLQSKGLGIHFVMDTAHPNAFTWATVELVQKLTRAGIKVSIPESEIHESIPEQQAVLLKKLMHSGQQNAFHVKWSHYWPHHLQAELKGDVNVEIICTNYRYRTPASHYDLWSRHIQLNHFRKLAVSRFNQKALSDLGFDPRNCPVVPLGYSPEIAKDFPDGASAAPRDTDALNILIVTNSHDLYRYGTDIAIKALAASFSADDNIVVHIKDYGQRADNNLLREWISSCDSFPRIKWHTDFLSKEDLLKLYASMDFLLSPFRGEGFSMKIIDAMALGVPVMMPSFGGPTEYAPEGTFLPVNHKEIPVGECFDRQHLNLGPSVYWCECYESHLSKQLKRASEDRNWLQRIGANARAHVLPRYSWNCVAERWAETLLSWHDEYKHTIETRHHDNKYDLSVLIPTKDRPELLHKALDAYAKQTLPSSRYELIIVNDHGDHEKVKQVCESFPSLTIRLLDNAEAPGPAGARNFGIEHACGRVLVITGDDIIPCPDFLAAHLEAHTADQNECSSFLGFSDWHPDVPTTPFHQMLTGRGGYQFDFGGLEDGQAVDWGRFYTSNISLKRSFIIQQEHLFSTRFPYAAFEDIEFAYRLYQRGMQMFFLKKATAFHLHNITPKSFAERQKKAGAMLTILTLMQPSAPIAQANMQKLKLLDHQCSNKPSVAASIHTQPEKLLDSMLSSYIDVLTLITASSPESYSHKLLLQNHRSLWEAINQLCLHLGITETWTQNAENRNFARQYLLLHILPCLCDPAGASKLSSPPDPDNSESTDAKTGILFRNSPFIFHASHALRTCPGLGRIFRLLENSTLARKLKNGVSIQLENKDRS